MLMVSLSAPHDLPIFCSPPHILDPTRFWPLSVNRKTIISSASTWNLICLCVGGTGWFPGVYIYSQHVSDVCDGYFVHIRTSFQKEKATPNKEKLGAYWYLSQSDFSSFSDGPFSLLLLTVWVGHIRPIVKTGGPQRIKKKKVHPHINHSQRLFNSGMLCHFLRYTQEHEKATADMYWAAKAFSLATS